MQQIALFLNKDISKSEKRRSEYGDLLDYFFSLGLEDSKGRKLSKGAIGFMIAPLILPDKNYSLLYTLKSKCDKSKMPRAEFWMTVKPKNK